MNIKYKAFNLDLTNRYDNTYKLNKWYSNDEPAFFFATNFEDCFRYYDSNNSLLCEIEIDGDTEYINDEYYGMYDIGKTSAFKIVKILSREEIINMATSLSIHRKKNFIKCFELIDDEIEYFKKFIKNNSELINFEYKYSNKKK